jgi:tetrahydromethanopterin S-methyltransferase subunit A
MTIEIKEGGEEESTGGLRPMAAEMVEVRGRMRGIDATVTGTGLLNKLQAGIYAGKIEGVALGMTVVLVLFGLILKVAGGK